MYSSINCMYLLTNSLPHVKYYNIFLYLTGFKSITVMLLIVSSVIILKLFTRALILNIM